jgi:hypothetical protein
MPVPRLLRITRAASLLAGGSTYFGYAAIACTRARSAGAGLCVAQVRASAICTLCYADIDRGGTLRLRQKSIALRLAFATPLGKAYAIAAKRYRRGLAVTTRRRGARAPLLAKLTREPNIVHAIAVRHIG